MQVEPMNLGDAVIGPDNLEDAIELAPLLGIARARARKFTNQISVELTDQLPRSIRDTLERKVAEALARALATARALRQ